MRPALPPGRRPPAGYALSRRALLAALPCLGLAAREGAAGPVSFPAAALRRYVDVLIPRDTTPEASRLGIHRALRRHAGTVPNYTQLLVEGGHWLDAEAEARAGLAFADLPAPEATRIVARAEAAPERTLPRVFFTFTRDDVMRLYYGRAESWTGLGDVGPPQPAGYPDAHLPPDPRG